MEKQYQNIVIQTLNDKVKVKEAEIDGHLSLIDIARKEITELKAAIAEHEKKSISKLQEKPKAVRGRKSLPVDLSVYSPEASLKNKLLFILKEKQRFLHIREVAKEIVAREPKLKEGIVVNKFGKYIWRFKEEGVIVPHRVEGSHIHTVYGLPEWLDKNEQIKAGFEYDPEKLGGRKKGKPAHITLFKTA